MSSVGIYQPSQRCIDNLAACRSSGLFPGLPRGSHEHGSAYLIEGWDERPCGGDPLQRQVRMFFSSLASRIGAPSGDTLLAKSLSSHFVPFRSPSFAYPNKTATLIFSTRLCKKILT